MAMDERGLGQKLQAARQAAGLTQQQLCHRANLSFSTLTKIERGAIKAPSVFTIQAIAGALGVGLDELVGQAPNARKLQMTKSGVRFVFFDVNGCLVHYYQRAFGKLAAATGAPADIVETAFWHFNDAVCRGVTSMSDFNTELATRLAVDKVNWNGYYLESVEAIKPMHELLEWASQRYKFGLLSNIMPGQISAMRRSGKLPDLPYDVIIDSSEVGLIKPEAKIYQMAQEKTGCSPEEILFVDDTRANLMAAEKHGWRVMWFDDSLPEESAERVREALEPATEN